MRAPSDRFQSVVGSSAAFLQFMGWVGSRRRSSSNLSAAPGALSTIISILNLIHVEMKSGDSLAIRVHFRRYFWQ